MHKISALPSSITHLAIDKSCLFKSSVPSKTNIAIFVFLMALSEAPTNLYSKFSLTLDFLLNPAVSISLNLFSFHSKSISIES